MAMTNNLINICFVREIMKSAIFMLFLLTTYAQAGQNDKDTSALIFSGCIEEAIKDFKPSIGMWYEYCGCFTHEAGKTWTSDEMANVQNKNHKNYRKLRSELDTLVEYCLKKSLP
jgi:hypothetical protein